MGPVNSERTIPNERAVICGTPNCFAADGQSGCRDGYTPVPTCPNIQHIEATEPDVLAATIPPWSGLPLARWMPRLSSGRDSLAW